MSYAKGSTVASVAERYGVSRESQDAYALQSQQRTARAQVEGRYDAEMAPLRRAGLLGIDQREVKRGPGQQQEIAPDRDIGQLPPQRLFGELLLQRGQLIRRQLRRIGHVDQHVAEILVGDDGAIDCEDENLPLEAWDVLQDATEVRRLDRGGDRRRGRQ